jgi:hypothetical protein
MVRRYTSVGRLPIMMISLVLSLFIASLVSAEPDKPAQSDKRVSKTFILQSGPSYPTSQTIPPRPEMFAPLTSQPRRMNAPTAPVSPNSRHPRLGE